MNAQEIFKEQLLYNDRYTLAILQAAVQAGQMLEDSDVYRRRLKCVGDRVVYAVVYRDTGVISAHVEMFFESELEHLMQELESTHIYNGYSGTSTTVPQFVLKKKETTDGST